MRTELFSFAPHSGNYTDKDMVDTETKHFDNHGNWIPGRLHVEPWKKVYYCYFIFGSIANLFLREYLNVLTVYNQY